MLCEASQKNGKIKQGPKMLNFGTSKPGVRGTGPTGTPSGSTPEE